jgi:hypothetical protein
MPPLLHHSLPVPTSACGNKEAPVPIPAWLQGANHGNNSTWQCNHILEFSDVELATVALSC